jgi:hypothetical protein
MNTEQYNVSELSYKEMEETNGGFVLATTLLVAAGIFVIGVIVAYTACKYP